MKLSTFDAFKHISDNSELIVLEGDLLRKLQNELLGILDDVVEVCESQGTRYTLGGGTCLGAIRHKGFIPWDDDIDINVLRDDLDDFICAFLKIYGDKYWVHTPRTKGHGLDFVRIRKRGTVLRGRDDFELLDECGLSIDVFIIETVPDNKLLRLVHGVGSLALGFVYSCRRQKHYYKEYLKLSEGNPDLQKSIRFKAALGSVFSGCSLEWWVKAWDKWNSCCKGRESRFVSIPVGRKHYFGELQLKETFFPSVLAEYEGRMLCVPGKYDSYLTALYGPDYMVEPDESDRESHVVYEINFGENNGR